MTSIKEKNQKSENNDEKGFDYACVINTEFYPLEHLILLYLSFG